MMKKERIFFYLLRLKKSSLTELTFRARQFVLLKKLKKRLSGNQSLVPTPTPDLEKLREIQLPALNGPVDHALVSEILAGRVFSLNTQLAIIEEFEQKAGDIFFDDIRLSDQDPDIRAVWEVARLQHLFVLLRHIFITQETGGRSDVLQFVKDAVIGWIQKNPFPLGPHYISAMECGLRIPLFIYCLKTLDILSTRECRLILDTVFQHAWLISRRLSLFSSLGNHTVAEGVGLLFAGAIYANTPDGRYWLETGWELLKQELPHQILNDGGPAEQSFNYHRFVLDLYWMAVGLLEKNRLYDCSSFKKRLKQGEFFLSAFKDSRGRLPSLGDSDDGYAIAPGLYPHRNNPDYEGRKILSFADAGYTVIRVGDAVLTFDHGPLGMAPLYNHGHADALSITLSINGKALLVDPGTYRYNGAPEFRRYFKSTRAHNTVAIDGLDQAVQESGFIWSHPYTAELLENAEIDGGFFLRAFHDGYTRLKKPVRHFRTLVYLEKGCFLIKDTFSGSGNHRYEMFYHLHPDANTEKVDSSWWQVENRGALIYICMLDDKCFDFARGRRNPLTGWYSPAYGVKRESGCLSCTETGLPQDVSFLTAIYMSDPPADAISERFFY